jgi:hypothetical protein
VRTWASRDVIPKMMHGASYFTKNAVFSDKFDFTNCISTEFNIVNHMININYDALMLGANGTEELILREIVPYNNKEVPEIYGGLPLRTEFRVFYDFSNKKIAYIVNYWDHEYCAKGMRSKTDQIIFEYMSPSIALEFSSRKSVVYKLVSDAMSKVKGLSGFWSVDIMLNRTDADHDDYVLIDMAPAEHSAYWDESKV